jgi:tetrahydromethanopterin S-methyltransferase subunit G
LTAAVDQGFIQKIEQASLQTVQSFNSEISVGINDVAAIDEDIKQEQGALQITRDEITKKITLTNANIATLSEQLDTLPKRSLLDVVKLKKKNEAAQAVENQITNKEQEINRLQIQLTSIEKKLECIVIKQSGRSCEGNLSKLKNMFSAEKVSEISQKINQTIDDLITVLVSLVLTTIIIPLAFLYLSYRLFRFFIVITSRFNVEKNNEEKPMLEDKNSLKN